MPKWTVQFQPVVSDKKIEARSYTLVLLYENGVPLFDDFVKAVEAHFELFDQSFYFEDVFDERVDATNISACRNGTDSILYIQYPQERLHYFQKVKIVPSTLIKRNQCIRYTTTSALCEFIDNSIQYTENVSEDEERLISACMEPNKLVVFDNGVGMTKRAFKQFATLSEKGFVETDEAAYVHEEKGDDVLFFMDQDTKEHIIKDMGSLFSSFLSKWGTGAKLAMDKLGRHQTIDTTVRGNSIIHIGKLDRDNTDWDFHLSEIKCAPEYHGTRILIQQLDPITNRDAIYQKLCCIYYFYCNGYSDLLRKVFELAFSHQFTKSHLALRIIPDVTSTLKTVSLKINNKNVDTRWFHCLENAKSVFPVYLKYYLPPPTINTVSVTGTSCYFEHIAVIFVFYFPYDEKELYPANSKRTEWFWLGRLLPEESTTLHFMKPEANRTKIRTHFLSRTKACVFLNRAYIPTPEKNQLIHEESGRQALLTATKDPALLHCFQEWILDCHKVFDKELVFSDELSTEILDKQSKLKKFKTVETKNNVTITTGDFVRIEKKKNGKSIAATEKIYGKVEFFQYRIVGDQVKEDQMLCYRPYCIRFLRATTIPMEDYELFTFNQAERKTLIATLDAENFVSEIAIFPKIMVPKGRGLPQMDRIPKRITGNTKDSFDLQVFLLNAGKRNRVTPVKLMYYSLSWKLVHVADDTVQATGNAIAKPRRFNISIPGPRSPGKYNLVVTTLLETVEILSETMDIVVNSSPPTKLQLQSIPLSIKLGSSFQLPSLLIFDEVNEPCLWRDSLAKNQVPYCYIANEGFSFKKNLTYTTSFGFDGTILNWEENEIVLTSSEPLSSGANISLIFSLGELEKKLDIDILPGTTMYCEIECPEEFQKNRTMLPLSFSTYDQWKSQTACKMGLEYYSTNEIFNPSISAIANAPLPYNMTSELFSCNPNHSNSYTPITLLGYPHISNTGKETYHAFTVAGSIFQTGDYFRIPAEFLSGRSDHLGLILCAYSDVQNGKEEFLFDFLLVANPRKPRSRYKNVFAQKSSWDAREVCLTDNIAYGKSIEALVFDRVYVTTQKQCKAMKTCGNVFFCSTMIGYQSKMLYNLYGNVDNMSSYIYMIGSPRGIVECTENISLELLEKEFLASDLGTRFYSSSFQWLYNGEVMEKVSDIPDGSVLLYLPVRACFEDDTNETISITIKNKEVNQILVSHRRIALKPARTPSFIKLTVLPSDNISFDNNIIRGINESPLTLSWTIWNEMGKRVKKTPKSVLLKESSGAILHHINQLQDSFHIVMPKMSPSLILFRLEIDFEETGKISRNVWFSSIIGLPTRLKLKGWKLFDEMEDEDEDEYESIQPARQLLLRCGEQYSFSFLMYDIANNEYNKDTIINTFENVSFSGRLLGGELTAIEKISMVRHSDFLHCYGKVISKAKDIEMCICASITLEEGRIIEIESGLIKATILPGEPRNFIPLDVPTMAKTYQPIFLQVKLTDEGNNAIDDTNGVSVLMVGTGGDKGPIPLTSTRHGIFESEFAFHEAGSFPVKLMAPGAEDFSFQVIVENPHGIASDIQFDAASLISIRAGSTVEMKVCAISKTKKLLNWVFISLMLEDVHGRVYSLKSPITKAGEYVITAKIDKEDSIHQEAILVRKSIQVIPLEPNSIFLSERLDARVILKDEKEWLWPESLTVFLVDCYGNPCRTGKIHLKIDLLHDDKTIWTTSVPCRNGEAILTQRRSDLPALEGDYSLIFTCDVTLDNRIQRVVEFSTVTDERSIQKRKLQLESQRDALKAEIKALSKQIARPIYLEAYDQVKIERTKLEKLKTRKVIPNPSFQRGLKILERMSVYVRYRNHFLGTLCNLGSIGGLGWDSTKENFFNAELSKWIGEGILQRIAIYCANQPQMENTIIVRVKHELGNQSLHLWRVDHNISRVDVTRDEYRNIRLPSVRATGFIGYAVNLITLTEEQHHLELRARLWYRILKDTMVFDTTDNLTSYCTSIRDGNNIMAFTLDGLHQKGSRIDLRGSAAPPAQKAFGRTVIHSSQEREKLEEIIQGLEEIILEKPKLQEQMQTKQELIKELTSNIGSLGFTSSGHSCKSKERNSLSRKKVNTSPLNPPRKRRKTTA